ncbi:MAG: hypothetical protein P9F19_15795 [Candidatus Contendobacter sp.]|nr:hypothetical protein [Candidatus Contendobacter sp.]MDG4558834.1 hypothetical protein [Candidatus Contendobacter sp.]
MIQKDDNATDFVIKIPRSLFDRGNDSTPDKRTELDHRSLERCGLVSTEVERSSEHGVTQVKSLGFADDVYCQRVLDLLDGPALFSKLPELFALLRNLGIDVDAEKRYFASTAVTQLLRTQPFSDLKTEIILPWANSEFGWARQSASIALAGAIEGERYRSEVLTLLKHWISNDNIFLTDCALLTFYHEARSVVMEALDAIGKIVSTGQFHHIPWVLDIFEVVYDAKPSSAIERLHTWMFPVAQSDFCWIAGGLVLNFLRIGDFVADAQSRRLVVDMIHALWDDPRFPFHQQAQEQTTETIRKWAKDALELWGKESEKMRDGFRAFFCELHEKYKGARRNRLDFYLRRWHLQEEQARARNSRRNVVSDQDATNIVSYLDLLPDPAAD